jgi:hypothetical protein
MSKSFRSKPNLVEEIKKSFLQHNSSAIQDRLTCLNRDENSFKLFSKNVETQSLSESFQPNPDFSFQILYRVIHVR